MFLIIFSLKLLTLKIISVQKSRGLFIKKNCGKTINVMKMVLKFETLGVSVSTS